MSDKRVQCPTCDGYGWKQVAIRDVSGNWREDVVWCESCNGYGYLLKPTVEQEPLR